MERDGIKKKAPYVLSPALRRSDGIYVLLLIPPFFQKTKPTFF